MGRCTRRVIDDATLDKMDAARRKGATPAFLAREFGFDDETTRRALARRAKARTASMPAPVPRKAIHVKCPASCRALLVAEAAKRGLPPARLAAVLLRDVLHGEIVQAVLCEA